MNLAVYETRLVRLRRCPSPGEISDAMDAARACLDLASLDREHLVRLDLDTRNHLISRETVHIGTADTAVLSVATFLRGAILNGAAKCIMVHNHPSGDPDPSPQDRTTTRRLAEAAAILDLPLVDSIIIGQDGRYYSCMHGRGGRVTPPPRDDGQRSLVGY